QIPAVGGRQSIFAITPRHYLHRHPAPIAVNASHPISPENQNPPDRHELEFPFLKVVVPSTRPTTTRAERTAVLSRLDLDPHRRPIVVLLQANLVIDKRLELLHSIEDRLDTHSGALPVLTKCGNSILTDGCLRTRSPLIGADSNLAFPPAFTIASPSTERGEA